MDTLLHSCGKVHEPMELSFEVVNRVDRGMGALEGGPCAPLDEGLWILFPHFFGA